MPRGFSGNAARRYLGDVAEAQAQATSATQGMPSGSPPMPRPRPLPFSPDSAGGGGFSVGHGDSGNIVVSQGDYETVARRLAQIDEQMGECLYQCAKEIEDMCDTIFKMPTVSPRCKRVSGGVIACLGQLRTLTEDVGLCATKFARDIMEIG